MRNFRRTIRFGCGDGSVTEQTNKKNCFFLNNKKSTVINVVSREINNTFLLFTVLRCLNTAEIEKNSFARLCVHSNCVSLFYFILLYCIVLYSVSLCCCCVVDGKHFVSFFLFLIVGRKTTCFAQSDVVHKGKSEIKVIIIFILVEEKIDCYYRFKRNFSLMCLVADVEGDDKQATVGSQIFERLSRTCNDDNISSSSIFSFFELKLVFFACLFLCLMCFISDLD